MALPTVAIVGRPNVGKSTLFNRIAGERISIVEDIEGVTRDRIYATGEWLNRSFSMIDTGGIDDVDAPFMEQIKHQAEIAMEEADVIVFVVSGKEGITDADEYVARKLYKTHKPVILAVNKVDNPEMRNDIYDFYALGVGRTSTNLICSRYRDRRCAGCYCGKTSHMKLKKKIQMLLNSA